MGSNLSQLATSSNSIRVLASYSPQISAIFKDFEQMQNSIKLILENDPNVKFLNTLNSLRIKHRKAWQKLKEVIKGCINSLKSKPVFNPNFEATKYQEINHLNNFENVLPTQEFLLAYSFKSQAPPVTALRVAV